MVSDDASVLAAMLKALAHPIRVRLVSQLAQADRSVSELQAAVKVGLSTVSRHLAHLLRVGIVSTRKQGVRVMCHLETPCILLALSCSRQAAQTALKKQLRALGVADASSRAQKKKVALK
jgi:ArsR family transcriptional regulator